MARPFEPTAQAPPAGTLFVGQKGPPVSLPFGKIRTLRALPWSEKWLVLELAWEMARARFEVGCLPFRAYAPSLGPLHPVQGALPPPLVGPEQDRLAARVSGYTRSLAGLVPWRCACLVRAMAARRVLQRRGCPTVLVLGARVRRGMEAHAWLCCGDRVVTGRGEIPGYTPVGLFAGPS